MKIFLIVLIACVSVGCADLERLMVEDAAPRDWEWLEEETTTPTLTVMNPSGLRVVPTFYPTPIRTRRPNQSRFTSLSINETRYTMNIDIEVRLK